MAVPGDINYDPSWDQPGGDTSQKGVASPPLGSDLNWQGSNPADLNKQYAGLDPARQQEYVKTWLGLDPGTQNQWLNAFGWARDPGGQPYDKMGAANAPTTKEPAGNPWDATGGDTTGKGLPSPPLGSDLNWQGSNIASMNAQYGRLDPVRQQEYVKAWLGLDPATQAQWAAAFGYGPQAGGGWGPTASGSMYSPTAQGPMNATGGGTYSPTAQGPMNATGGGTYSPTAQGPMNATGGGTATPGAAGGYPQSWIDTYNAQTPEVQAAMRDRWTGKTQAEIEADWRNNIAPQHPGWSNQQILSGTGPAGGGGGTGAPGAPAGGAGGGAGGGLAAPPMGGPGSLSRAMASGRQAGMAAMGPSDIAGTDLQSAGGIGNNWVGGPYSHEAAWEEPFHQRNDGTMQYAPGYGPGANGGGIKWDGGKPPTGGYTTGGQNQLRQPFTAGGQNFNGLKQFVKYMMQSSPGEQALKKQLEGFDEKGGSLEPGEKSLFDLFAPYLAKGSWKMPTTGTPFTNWDPTSLLDVLFKSGVLTRPPGT